jgi:co-chaperonin GroES (HSP10)
MSFIEDGKRLVEVAHKQQQGTKMSGATIIMDGENAAAIPGYPYIFEAEGDNLLVFVDIFKSGYECKECQGAGRVEKKCECESIDRPGFKYSTNALIEAQKELGDAIASRRASMHCPSCEGRFLEKRQVKECTTCNGKGHTLFLPDQAKILPATGVIVSVGPDLAEDPRFKVGMRKLFGPYSGVMVPTKIPGIVFKVLRKQEILLNIRGGEDLPVFDFVTLGEDLK